MEIVSELGKKKPKSAQNVRGGHTLQLAKVLWSACGSFAWHLGSSWSDSRFRRHITTRSKKNIPSHPLTGSWMYYITSITIVIHKFEILNMYICIYTHCICYLYICNYTYIYIYIGVRVSLNNVHVECRTYMYMQQMHTFVCNYCYVYKCKYTLIDVSVI